MQEKFAGASLLDPWPRDAGPQKITSRGAAMLSLWPAGSLDYLPGGHWIGVMLAPSRGLRLAFESEKFRTTNASIGMLAVNPAGLEGRARWDTELESALVSIAPENMLDLAGHEFDCTDLEIRPTHLTADYTALHFGKLLKAELNNPDHTDELYLDSLITLFGIHVLRKYSNVARPRKTRKSGLSPVAAKRAREYLHEHFRRKVTIAELAGICGLSPGHFAEAFAKTFGSPPHRYLIERRLDFAERLLGETELSIPEVAFLSGFSSQSHLTNVMKTHWGKTPYQLR